MRDMVDDLEDAAAAAHRIQTIAFNILRTRFPFLDADALARLVEGVKNYTVQELAKQEVAMTQSKARFSFFSIPPELRNRIYEDVLDVEQHQCQEPIHVGYWRDPPHPRPLLQVSRQIREEALPIFLGQHTFIADVGLPDPQVPLDHSVTRWLSMLGSRNAKHIKKLVVMFDVDDVADFKRYGELGAHPSTLSTPEDILRTLRLDRYGVKREAFNLEFYHHEMGCSELKEDGRACRWGEKEEEEEDAL